MNWIIIIAIGAIVAVVLTLVAVALHPSPCDPSKCPPVTYSLAQTSGCMPGTCPPPKCEGGVCR